MTHIAGEGQILSWTTKPARAHGSAGPRPEQHAPRPLAIGPPRVAQGASRLVARLKLTPRRPRLSSSSGICRSGRSQRVSTPRSISYFMKPGWLQTRLLYPTAEMPLRPSPRRAPWGRPKRGGRSLTVHAATTRMQKYEGHQTPRDRFCSLGHPFRRVHCDDPQVHSPRGRYPRSSP